jgi:putative sterol carrier protein
MTIKKKTSAKRDKQPESKEYAKVSLSASYMGAILSDSFTKTILPQAELDEVVSALNDKIAVIQDGNMKPIEAMLVSQAQALQTMFVTLGRMASVKTQLAQYTAFMNMALRAQSQSRATIQALIELKYPKQATFVKQANIANGHQQVNNATNTCAPARANEIQNPQNQLLEAEHNEWVDYGKTATTSTIDSPMETLEK